MKEIEGLECIHIQGSNHYNPPISPLLSSLTVLSLSTLLPFFRLLSFWHIDFVNIQVYLITWLRQKGGKQQPSVSSLSSPLASFSQTISADVSLRCESWLQNHHNQFFLFFLHNNEEAKVENEGEREDICGVGIGEKFPLIHRELIFCELCIVHFTD